VVHHGSSTVVGLSLKDTSASKLEDIVQEQQKMMQPGHYGAGSFVNILFTTIKISRFHSGTGLSIQMT
jgi:hypothetical protein